MWLLPSVSFVSRIAACVYYRLRVSGGDVPSHGPVLLVANHPNALLDPLLVVAAARRPVRFLAKAPLFSDWRIAWLMRAVGSIPVYRRSDDPATVSRNQEAFRSVHGALLAGSAVGIFPEGISHDDPSMAPLKTGTARMALSSSAVVGDTFPIIPVGLVLGRKDVFRSAAAVIVGSPVAWEDLGSRGSEDALAVHELTERLTDALRQVTVNLESWADRPLAECAVRIWEAERSLPEDAALRVSRLATTTRLLAWVRADAADRWDGLIRDVAAHGHRLERLGLRPADLKADVSAMRGVRWSAGRLWLLMLPATGVALLGFLLFWPAYRLVARIVDALRPGEVARSTTKLLAGSVIYTSWVAFLAIGVAFLAGPLWGAGLLIALPALGVAGLVVREQWLGALGDARRFFLLRSRRSLVRSLRERQAGLAARLQELLE